MSEQVWHIRIDGEGDESVNAFILGGHKDPLRRILCRAIINPGADEPETEHGHDELAVLMTFIGDKDNWINGALYMANAAGYSISIQSMPLRTFCAGAIEVLMAVAER